MYSINPWLLCGSICHIKIEYNEKSFNITPMSLTTQYILLEINDRQTINQQHIIIIMHDSPEIFKYEPFILTLLSTQAQPFRHETKYAKQP